MSRIINKNDVLVDLHTAQTIIREVISQSEVNDDLKDRLQTALKIVLGAHAFIYTNCIESESE